MRRRYFVVGSWALHIESVLASEHKLLIRMAEIRDSERLLSDTIGSSLTLYCEYCVAHCPGRGRSQDDGHHPVVRRCL